MWSGPRNRWCTTTLKREPREKYLKEITKEYDTIIHYTGLAADEEYRLKRKNNLVKDQVHHLEKRFDLEEERVDKHWDIKSNSFYKTLRILLGRQEVDRQLTLL